MTGSGSAIQEAFKVEVPDFLPRYNIAPSQLIATILIDDQGTKKLDYLRWDLIPSWAKDPAISYKLINARSEIVSEKPSFRYAFKHRRCVILADGFYEWQRAEGSKTKKQPYYFTLKDSQFMAFAGLWERWESSEGDVINSCTILTVEANELLQPIHDRMPVILQSKDYDVRLNRSVISGDRGGSNSSSYYIFKEDLQKLANEIGIEIRVAHYPPYTFKYNPIEHRLFPHVTRACQGAIFTSIELVKSLIEKTSTKTGLKVVVNLMDKVYAKGREVADGFKENLPITFDEYLPKWNYRAIPHTSLNA